MELISLEWNMWVRMYAKSLCSYIIEFSTLRGYYNIILGVFMVSGTLEPGILK